MKLSEYCFYMNNKHFVSDVIFGMFKISAFVASKNLFWCHKKSFALRQTSVFFTKKLVYIWHIFSMISFLALKNAWIETHFVEKLMWKEKQKLPIVSFRTFSVSYERVQKDFLFNSSIYIFFNYTIEHDLLWHPFLQMFFTCWISSHSSVLLKCWF